jgi:hypothetical protein
MALKKYFVSYVACYQGGERHGSTFVTFTKGLTEAAILETQEHIEKETGANAVRIIGLTKVDK